MLSSDVALRVETLRVETDWPVERARILRTLHDTVLQALEAMSLSSDLDHTAPAAAVAELRGTARSQAARLRRAMAELMEIRHTSLAAAIEEVAGEYAQTGLRVEVAFAQGLPEVTAPRRDALREATRAALGNVRKHAGVASAVVRADAADRGLQLVVRDRGAGFSAADHPAGFGIQQSMLARLHEVGGTASVQSWPGAGTRVRLWVPA